MLHSFTFCQSSVYLLQSSEICIPMMKLYCTALSNRWIWQLSALLNFVKLQVFGVWCQPDLLNVSFNNRLSGVCVDICTTGGDQHHTGDAIELDILARFSLSWNLWFPTEYFNILIITLSGTREDIQFIANWWSTDDQEYSEWLPLLLKVLPIDVVMPIIRFVTTAFEGWMWRYFVTKFLTSQDFPSRVSLRSRKHGPTSHTPPLPGTAPPR